MRIAAGIEYDGSTFCGWQRQQHCHSVQAELEQALSRVANHPVSIHAAGRTDTGVHASGQVVHFDTDAARPDRAWLLGCNTQMVPQVRVLWAVPVVDDFHARFDAISRQYRYFIHNRTVRSAIHHAHVTWERRPLDAQAMHQAAQALVGDHDFSAFRAAGCQALHPHRRMFSISVQRQGDSVMVQVNANAFLHNMVRNIVGVLLDVGAGVQNETYPAQVLASGDRRQGSRTAAPNGLYLQAIEYSPHFGIPQPQAVQPFIL